ncbi:MAG: hypothetical protein IKH61_04900 [Bacteroidales bacterium]|nr:hypothetical protein [Bacteroidales bacterium]
MKKVLFIVTVLFLTGMITYCYGQNVNVNITYGNHGEYYINGICSDKDIGGVECDLSNDDEYALFTNYNSFPVTVICVIGFEGRYRDCCNFWSETKEVVFNIVMQPKESRYCRYATGGELYTEARSIKGMIVRKLAQ